MALGTRTTEQTQTLDRIGPHQLRPELVEGMPLEFLKSQRVIPIVLEDGAVAIATADPTNVEAYDAVVTRLIALPAGVDRSWALKGPCPQVICPAQEIDNAISHCYYTQADLQVEGLVAEGAGGAAPAPQAGDPTRPEDLMDIAHQGPVIKLVNTLLYRAAKGRASDIHIEPYDGRARVRFRVDGVLHEVMTIPKGQVAALESRLKIMANLNIAERRLPQDGQSRIKIGQDLVDIRVSTLPTLGGERVVLRLLDKGRGQLGLAEIGFGPQILDTFRSLIRIPHGILLLTGPTGSGKTTTLYAALNELNSEQRNILTVEDPVEYQLPGIGQMQVKPKIGLTFAQGLRHMLRQDPDILMIGEIRDAETAQIAIQASMTGHLVFSTLHTNDAASAVTRLIDMGIEPYLISSSLLAVMAQRLVRVVCPSCQVVDPDGPLAACLHDYPRLGTGGVTLRKGQGCDDCMQTGFHGRTAIFELLLVDDPIRNLIIGRSPSHVLRGAAIDKGMVPLREEGLAKALEGKTTVEEVLRVTQDALLATGGGEPRCR